MFVLKSKYHRLVCDYKDLKYDKYFAEEKIAINNKIIKEYLLGDIYGVDNKAHCHKFGKWKQDRVEEFIIDMYGLKTVSYKSKQVRKCKKCGFMESVDI